MASTHVEDPSHTTGYDPRRLQTHVMEIGFTEAVQKVRYPNHVLIYCRWQNEACQSPRRCP